MTKRRSAFAPPQIHAPPGAHSPLKLLFTRALRDLIALLPSRISQRPAMRRMSRRLELKEIWHTDMLAYRVERAREMGIKVGNGCRLYSLNVASEAELIEIGDNVIVSGEVMFVTHDGAIFTALDKFPNVNGHYGKIRIGSNCFLGMRAIIMPGVELGDNCVVAAGAVVMDSFAPNSVIAGNPAAYVCPTQMYLQMKRYSSATVYDEAHPFPHKMPPAQLAAHFADLPYKAVVRRESAGKQASSGGATASGPARVRS